ncbi:MAG: hypothetical protein LBC43_03595 [Bifidobacteriaceae bacterium]|jgi:hypothetical protein|nr:hypothetical protein [Bifidobacteriaceae bacterium]
MSNVIFIKTISPVKGISTDIYGTESTVAAVSPTDFEKQVNEIITAQADMIQDDLHIERESENGTKVSLLYNYQTKTITTTSKISLSPFGFIRSNRKIAIGGVTCLVFIIAGFVLPGVIESLRVESHATDQLTLQTSWLTADQLPPVEARELSECIPKAEPELVCELPTAPIPEPVPTVTITPTPTPTETNPPANDQDQNLWTPQVNPVPEQTKQPAQPKPTSKPQPKKSETPSDDEEIFITE